MKICGIDITSCDANLAVIEKDGEKLTYFKMQKNKISLKNDDDVSNVRTFYSTFCAFVRDNNIEIIALKKRSKKGFQRGKKEIQPGGPVSFKIEALIQLCSIADVILVPFQSVSATWKKKEHDLPEGLKKYQFEAYKTAFHVISKDS